MEDQTHWDEVNAHIIPEENLEQSIRQLQVKREDCVAKKQALEQQLNKIENWKRSETSVILARGLDKTRAITATANLEVAVRKKKVPVLNAKQELETRLRELKSELCRMQEIKERICKPERKRDDVEVLLRIEQLLIKMVSAVQAERKTD